MKATKKMQQKKSELLQKGDLVLLVDDNGKDIAGIILETKEWPSEGMPMLDIYVRWSTGECYWCISAAVRRIGCMLKKNN